MTQPHNKTRRTKFQARIEAELTHGRITPQQGLVLGLTEQYLMDNPDGEFAGLLVDMLQGDGGQQVLTARAGR